MLACSDSLKQVDARMTLAMPSLFYGPGDFAVDAAWNEARMFAQKLAKAQRGNNELPIIAVCTGRSTMSMTASKCAISLLGAPRRAWSVINDNTHVDRRASPGGNPGRRQQGQPH